VLGTVFAPAEPSVDDGSEEGVEELSAGTECCRGVEVFSVEGGATGLTRPRETRFALIALARLCVMPLCGILLDFLLVEAGADCFGLSSIMLVFPLCSLVNCSFSTSTVFRYSFSYSRNCTEG
jgi:hypothetical protein